MMCFWIERSSIAAGWIPAFAGMTDEMDSCLRGNDVACLCGNDVAGVVAGVCDIGVEFNLPQAEHFTSKRSTKSRNG